MPEVIKIKKGAHLFSHVEYEPKINKEPGVKEIMTGLAQAEFSDWEKLDLRVAKIKKAADHPNADKLVILTIDVGEEEKQIVAGIRKDYTNKQLEGKEIIVVNNLKPVELRGVKSNGMLLAATDGDKVVLLKPDKDVESGSEVK